MTCSDKCLQIEDRRLMLKEVKANVRHALTSSPYSDYTVSREYNDAQSDLIIKFQGVLFRVKVTRKQQQ